MLKCESKRDKKNKCKIFLKAELQSQFFKIKKHRHVNMVNIYREHKQM